MSGAVRPEDHLRLAWALALRFCRRLPLCSADVDDACQEACVALVMAARGYDESKGIWSHYAGQAIRRALRLWFHRGRLVSPPDKAFVANAPRFVALDAREARQRTVHEADLSQGVFIQELQAALHRLPDEQRRLLEARFGLGGAEERTLAAIGAVEGVSREAIWKRQGKALDRLKKEIGEV